MVASAISGKYLWNNLRETILESNAILSLLGIMYGMKKIQQV